MATIDVNVDDIVAVPQCIPSDAHASSPEAPRVLRPWVAARANESYLDPQALINGERYYIRDMLSRARKIIVLARRGNNPLILCKDVGPNKIVGSIAARMIFHSELKPSTTDIQIELPNVYPFRYQSQPSHLKSITQSFYVHHTYDDIATYDSEGAPIINPNILAFPILGILSSEFASRQVSIRTHPKTPALDILNLGLLLQATFHAHVHKQGTSLRMLLPDQVSSDTLNAIKRSSPIIKDVVPEGGLKHNITDRSSNAASSEATSAPRDDTKMMLKKGDAPLLTETAVRFIVDKIGAVIVKFYEASVLIKFPNKETADKFSGATINGGRYIIEPLEPAPNG